MKYCKNCLFNSQNYPSIQLNNEGVCDICEVNLANIASHCNYKSTNHLEQMIRQIKSSKNGKYDCLIGISGGADSTYLVYLAKKWGLNPLLFHVDGGWNSEISTSNIKHLIQKSGYDFISEVLPWEEIKDVERAFISSNVIDIDLPFDNLIVSYNYRIAKKYKIKYILCGSSAVTEGIMPSHFAHYKFDKKNILSIHKNKGNVPLNGLKFIGTFTYLWFERIQKIKFLEPLDWIEYNKVESKKIIEEEFDWKDYGWKHNENIYTRFYQNYILPKKFNVDKRISHLSMLICSNQITKANATAILANSPLYSDLKSEKNDRDFFLKKLNVSDHDFETYLSSPQVSHRNYKSDLDIYDLFKPIYQFFKHFFKFKFFNI